MHTCESRYWSSHRFSEKVVASMNEAVDQLMKESGAKQLRLVGFSGGGAV
ncbi:MAG: alpha/beta hydrolase, partial [Gammaproteobacteria bacterium]|nr:alpha/beta hydrolase [Gammaproteobacteria bacterium]